MKKIVLFSAVILIFASILSMLLMTGCTGGNELSGGSGVGNPGGQTTISLVADTQAVIVRKNDVNILSEDSILFTIKTAKILVKEIVFVLFDSDGDSLFNGYKGDKTTMFSNDSTISIVGHFVFDAMTGTSDPSLSGIMIPEGNYKGINLVIEDDSSFGGNNFNGYAIQLSGTFIYDNSEKIFAFNLNILGNNVNSYKTKGSSVFVSADSHTCFTILMRPEKWLDNIDFLVDYPELIVGDSLIIDSKTQGHIFQMFKISIKQNIFRSGKLISYKL